MVYSYYPGCTLKTQAKQLDIYARDVARALDITLEEVPSWQCCGAVYPMAKDEIGTRLSSVRTLVSARDEKRSLITLCSACHQVIKRVNNDMATDETIRSRANNYLKLDTPYAGETKVIHYLEMLRDEVGFDALKARVKNPLKGRKIAAYYGCLLLRPSDVMKFDNPENPSIIENLIRALGAEPVVYPYRNECCGGYVTLEDQEMIARMSGKVVGSAGENGADAIVTACPLCKYNLGKNTAPEGIPTYYFTELMAEALGVK